MWKPRLGNEGGSGQRGWRGVAVAVAVAFSLLPMAASAKGDCPAGPPPPNPTYGQQIAVVDDAQPLFVDQARGYPPVPHLDPRKVAAAMATGEFSRDKFTFVIAHRGDHIEPGYAENGLSAIWRAYRSGADGIELDVKSDCQGKALLGHDVSTGREIDTPQWSLMDNFPATDPDYTDESSWPFRINKGGVGPYNLNRSRNYLGKVWNEPLNDQYENRSMFRDGQLTLYQGIYAVAKYAPMMVWLDIKTKDDLVSAMQDLSAVRAKLGDNPVLENFGLKLGLGTIKETGFDPRAYVRPYLDPAGLFYFAVVGVGDFEALAAAAPGQSLIEGLKIYCDIAKGCIGVELAHKYHGAPSQPLVDQLNATENYYRIQLAGFQTVPQYDWYSKLLENDRDGQTITENRGMPRTDGTCCFALEDSLNITASQAELLDRRASYHFNELNFSTITTDDTINMLRLLRQRGKRRHEAILSLGGDPEVPSGGGMAWKDGLYAIVGNLNGKDCFLLGYGGAVHCETVPFDDKEQIWSITGRSHGTAETLQFMNVQLGEVLVNSTSGPSALIRTGDNRAISRGISGFSATATSEPLTWQLRDYEGLAIVMAKDGLLRPVASGTPSAFLIYPVRHPAMEKRPAQNQIENRNGPPGTTFICDDGDTMCNRLHVSQKLPERVYYGVSPGKWLTHDIEPGTSAAFDCTAAWFGSDPAPGQVKACYRSQVFQYTGPPPSYAKVIATENQRLPAGPVSIAYGAINPSDQKWYGMFFPGSLTNGICKFPAGTADPLPGVAKRCWGAPPYSPPGVLDAYFATCGNVCGFTSPHVVIMVYTGSDGIERATYKSFTTGVLCEPRAFGIKAFKPTVHCFARPMLATVRDVPNFSWCAPDAGTCKLMANPSTKADRVLAAYASPDVGKPIQYQLVTGDFTCAKATFGGVDPDPGVAKSCYYKLY